MAVPLPTSRLVRFGEFELDLTTRELSSNGARQVLAPQPFQLLELLIENRGRLVTRDELVRQLWPNNTFVDYEQGLKKAVKRLREALHDSAEEPRYIETLPRQGYRFIAEIRDGALESPGHGRGPVEVPRPVAIRQRQPAFPVSRKMLLYAVGAVCALALLWIGFRFFPATPSLPRITESRALTNDGLPKFSLVSDHQRLYFVERSNGKDVIRQISLQGGEASTLEVPFADPFLLDFSSVRSELLVAGPVQRKHRELWAVTVPGGNARRVGDLITHQASWSHDGNQIVYAADNAVFTARPDGTSSLKIVSVAGTPYDPRFSPTDDRIRFNMVDPALGSISIWEVRSDGSQLRQLEFAANAGHGLWTVNGDYYFYNTWQLNQHLGKDIWVTSDSKPTQGKYASVRLTSGPLVFSDLALSGDGQTLFTMGTQARIELTRYDNQTKTFEPFLGGISATDVAISRDGKWAAYVSYPDLRLWRSRIDGSDRRQLTFGEEDAFLPQWSPDGSEILYTSLHERSIVYVVSRDGGMPHKLIPEDHQNQIDPTWTPDGRSVIFARTHLDPDLAIYRFDLGSRQIIKLEGSENLTAPRLSPDGRYVFAITREWNRGLLYDTTSGTWRELLKFESGGFGYPSWSNDSQWIYMREMGNKVMRIRIADRSIETVLDMNSIPDAGPSWIGLASDNSVLFFRDRSLHEIYAMSLQMPK